MKEIQMLKDGNKKYLQAKREIGDISEAVREDTCRNGQHPYALIVTCSDARVIPEAIFHAGIGDLFIIRVADLYHCLPGGLELRGAEIKESLQHTLFYRF